MEPEVSDYLNYRDYLRDFFNAKKAMNKSYSFRVFTHRADLGSPSHLKMVMDGQRNLTHKTIPKYVKGLGLKKKKDVHYFELLVKYNQCKERDLKVELFENLLKEKKRKDLTSIETHQLSFLSQWYYLAIYVLVDIPGFINDPEWIQGQLTEKISLAQIKQAIADLKVLDLVVEKDGTLRQTGGAISVPDEMQSVVFPKYHMSMNELAKNCLLRADTDVREFNGATLAVKKDDLPKLKKMIRAFRKEMNELTSSVDDPDSVYQLNIQFFPLTKEVKCDLQ